MSFPSALADCIASTPQSEVAAICEVTPAAVSNWMHGRSVPKNPRVVSKLLDGLDAPPEKRRALWEAYGVPGADLVAP